MAVRRFFVTISQSRRIFTLAVIGAFAHVLISCATAQELLEEVRTGNKAALESIRTLSCRITLAFPVGEQGPVAPTSADFWQKGDSDRLHFESANQINDAIRHEFTRKSLTRTKQPGNNEKKVFRIGRVNPDLPHSRFDPYGRGLLRLCGPKGGPLTLEELLSRKHKLGKLTRQPYQGHECVVLEMSIELDAGARGDFEFWFDPKVNYLVCKLFGDFTTLPGHPKVRRESQVLSFVEAAPGVYFPAQAETKFYHNGKLANHDIVTFSDIRINQPLPPNIFELAIPPNSTVIDAIQDRKYEVDAQGKPFGPESSIDKIPPLPAGSVQGPTILEPQPITRFVLYGLLLLLAIAGGIWYFRRLRAGSPLG